jgi:hypothetical protein
MRAREVVITAAAGLVFCLASACAHPKLNTRGGNPDVITEDDIERIHAHTAYDAVAKIHPNFLTRRGQTSLLGTSNPDPNVYLDDVFIGPVSELKGIQASVVSSIRVYRAGQTGTRFGAGNMGGVIEVYTKH